MKLVFWTFIEHPWVIFNRLPEDTPPKNQTPAVEFGDFTMFDDTGGYNQKNPQRLSQKLTIFHLLFDPPSDHW
jgi:hypothetical protein